MKIAIMQAYFLPYLGYWQLINAVDIFVVYDNIQYVKQSWINRNRFLQNGKDVLFSIPLKNDSDFLDIKDRFIASNFNKIKLLNQIKNAYTKAPYFKEAFPVFKNIIINNEVNLFKYVFCSIQKICEYLGIKTKIIISSSLNIDHSLKAEQKIEVMCKKLNINNYINAIGGQKLYNKSNFKQAGINLSFIATKDIKYKQYNNEFVPWLSIIDVMMFNSIEEIKKMLDNYELI